MPGAAPHPEDEQPSAALAYTGARLNVLNLIPVWMLDGGKAAGAIGIAGRVALLALCVGLSAYTGSLIFLFVAAGMIYRLFTKDKPTHEDWGICLYYAAILAALAFVLHVTPDSLFPQKTAYF